MLSGRLGGRTTSRSRLRRRITTWACAVLLPGLVASAADDDWRATMDARVEALKRKLPARAPMTGRGMPTKLGLLYLMGSVESEGFYRMARAGYVPIVKTDHHSADRSAEVAKHDARAIWILSLGGAFHPDKESPAETAERTYRELVEKFSRIPKEWRGRIDFISLAPCMWQPGDEKTARWYSEMLCELLPRFQDLGPRPIVLNSGVGGLPVGDPPEVLEAMIPGLRLAHHLGGAWGCHGYTLKYTMDEDEESWYSLRYRRAYAFFREHAPDLMTFPMILLEGGVDKAGDPDKDGYLARGPIEKYTEWLAWYDSQLRKDDYVLGVTLFKIGAPSIWKSFDLEPVIPWLYDYCREAYATRGAPNGVWGRLNLLPVPGVHTGGENSANAPASAEGTTMNRPLATMLRPLTACAALAAAPLLATAEVGGGTTDAPQGDAFAVDLYRRLAAGKGNIFFSPHSISSALAMTWAGARDGTREEMRKVLGFEGDPDEVHAAFERLQRVLEEGAKEGGYELTVANALWGQKGFEFLDEYLAILKERYGASLNTLDFRAAAESARETINRWVEDRTHGRIRDLLKPGTITAATRLVLTNAIYFKGKWSAPFDPQATREEPFHVDSSREVSADLMHREDLFAYGESGGVQVIELPYQGDDVSMVVLLPKERDGLAGLEEGLTPASLRKALGSIRRRKVSVYLPKFEMSSEFSLVDTLSKMGMPGAFRLPPADFSGMTGEKNLFISAVVHKAFVAVDEEGTEAAAATGIGLSVTSAVAPPPPVFRADHPFVFLIRHRPTGTILFMGRVVDPTA